MKKALIFLFVLALLSSCSNPYSVETKTDKLGYTYEVVKGDPQQVRIYKLQNGLTVYLAHMDDAPRIQTYIAVKAGSSYDPKATTGLAHYLEHMMFKGNSRIGSLDWDKEKVILQQISDLFEKHKSMNDTLEKKKIYASIDSLSQVASNLCVASEYDKMASMIGATGTNAWTSNEQTVYVNDIPANELERWIKLESTRFSELTLRLFHTELETVYEEFNMGQDRDMTRVYHTLFEALFPTHPYGTQTTIGKAEHLKNPSMVNIHNYFSTYYVPNNMAVCLSGDLDYEKTIKMIDEQFGKLKPNNEIPKFESPVEKPIDTVVVKNVYGREAESIVLAYRFNGVRTMDRIYVTIIDRILGNGTAGLIDLNLNQKQKVLDAQCWSEFLKYYGYHAFYAHPKEGQKLEEVRDLMLGEIEKIKKGEFDDWLVTAAINDIELDKLKQRDDYRYLASDFIDAFTNDIPWNEFLEFFPRLEQINKKELVDFANQNYNDKNYVVVYKRTGQDTSIVKVSKPQITPVKLNREKNSGFYTDFAAMKPGKLEPVFIDFKKDVQEYKVRDGIHLYRVENPHHNELFELNYLADKGSNDRLIPLAMGYLTYLGTAKYSPSQLQQEFYKLGIRFDQRVNDFRSGVTISGLNKSLEDAIKLVEEIVNEAKPDTAVYKEYVKDILKKRQDAKKSKEVILHAALVNYGLWGPKNNFNDFVPADSLYKIDPKTLTDLVKNLFFNYKHYFMYYGVSEPTDVIALINKHHKTAPVLQDLVVKKVYQENSFDKNIVYFVDYDMVQTNFVMVSKDQGFDPLLIPYAQIFSEYFGSGLSSVVFQEIREARALAYSAYAAYSIPSRPWDAHQIRTFVATQADKLKNATDAMNQIMNNMPKAEIQFNASKESIMKRIESDRISKTNIFWFYIRNKDLGIDHDNRMDTYKKIQEIKIEELDEFFSKHIKGKKYTYLVIGKKKDLDLSTLKKLGEFKELTLEEIFGY